MSNAALQEMNRRLFVLLSSTRYQLTMKQQELKRARCSREKWKQRAMETTRKNTLLKRELRREREQTELWRYRYKRDIRSSSVTHSPGVSNGR